MVTLSTWISALTSCTTIFSSTTSPFLTNLVQQNLERALVIFEVPWEPLSMTDVKDCATLLIHNEADLKNASESVLRSRKDINIVLSLSNTSSLYSNRNWSSYQTHFDIHILAKKLNGDIEGTKKLYDNFYEKN